MLNSLIKPQRLGVDGLVLCNMASQHPSLWGDDSVGPRRGTDHWKDAAPLRNSSRNQTQVSLTHSTRMGHQLLTLYHFKVAQDWPRKPTDLVICAFHVVKAAVPGSPLNREGGLLSISTLLGLSSYSGMVKRTGSEVRISGFEPPHDHSVTLRKLTTTPVKGLSFLICRNAANISF